MSYVIHLGEEGNKHVPEDQSDQCLERCNKQAQWTAEI